jgi:hypothetical protein
MCLGYYVMVVDVPATWRLWVTINARWTDIEVFLIAASVTTQRSREHQHHPAETHRPRLPQQRTFQTSHPPARCHRRAA